MTTTDSRRNDAHWLSTSTSLASLAWLMLTLLVLMPRQAHAQSSPAPSLTVAGIILVEPAVETPLLIDVSPTTPLPRNSFVRIKGLPAEAKLSEGHFVSNGTWALPLGSLSNLKVTVPLATTGRAELQLALLAIDGTVLAEARTILAVTGGAIGTLATPQPPQPPASQLPGRASLGQEPVLQQPPAQVLRSVPAPARNPAPAPSGMNPADREAAQKFMARGEEEFRSGDVATARLLFQRAADLGLPEAALAMGQTFDPAELARRGVRGMQGDIASARSWYQRAMQLGAAGAAERMSRLPP